MCKFQFLVAVIGLSAATVSGADIPQVATQAKAVLEKHGYECHGKNGSNEGNLNFILNRDRLVSSKKIVPGEPGDSLLLKKIRSEEMPPDRDNNGKKIAERPTPEDLATLRKWIEAGAPDFKPAAEPRKFISNTDVLEFIHQDQLKAAERSRRFLRYFTITHLYNAGMSEDELQSYRAGLSKLINSLSWGRNVVVPQPVDSAQTIFRIDLRDYRWKESTWARILEVNPYGVTYESRSAKAAYEIAHTDVPAIRADWFVFIASRPPLYHDLLELPTTAGELEKLLKVDVADNIQSEQVKRSAFNTSGVSRNNRMIERHESPHGAYWKSYDFASNVGRQNLFQAPLGPGENAKFFKHDGGEIIFNLPNGLQAYLLVDATGKRLDKAPTNIVKDSKQGDSAVVNGISCMSCHNKGMLPATDQIRKHVDNNPSAFSRIDAETIRV